MSSDKLQETFKRMMYTMAGVYRYEMTSELFATYFRVNFKSIKSEAHCYEVYNKIVEDPEIKFMPLPAELKKRFEGGISARSEAQAMIGNINVAIGKYGYMQGPEARKVLGEVAWKLICQKGGWRRICETANFSDTSYNAQFRDLAQALLEQVKTGQIIIQNFEQLEARKKAETEMLLGINNVIEGVFDDSKK